jgi:hypothetical protein
MTQSIHVAALGFHTTPTPATSVTPVRIAVPKGVSGQITVRTEVETGGDAVAFRRPVGISRANGAATATPQDEKVFGAEGYTAAGHDLPEVVIEDDGADQVTVQVLAPAGSAITVVVDGTVSGAT